MAKKAKDDKKATDDKDAGQPSQDDKENKSLDVGDTSQPVAVGDTSQPVAEDVAQVLLCQAVKQKGDFYWKCQCVAKEKAKLFCTDCPPGKQFFCHRCCILEHDWEGKNRLHSIEAIDPNQHTSHMADLFDVLLLPIIIFISIRCLGLPEGYNDGIDVCPIVGSVRKTLFHLDAGMVAMSHYWMPRVGYIDLQEQGLAFNCNLEDGYIRLWLDLFVRGIATNTDSLFLLIVTFIRAKLFHAFIVKNLFLPLAVMVHASYSYAIHSLPFPEPVWFRKVSIRVMDRVLPPSKRCPKTFPRSRPAKNFKDSFKYWWDKKGGRVLRKFNWFWDVANARLSGFSYALLWVPVVLRLTIMLLGTTLTRLTFGIVSRIFLPSSFATYDANIGGWRSANVDFAQVTEDTFSGYLFKSIALSITQFLALSVVPSVTQFILRLTPGFVISAINLVIRFGVPEVKFLHNFMLEYRIYALGIPVLLVYYGGKRAIENIIKEQEGAFKKREKDDKDFTSCGINAEEARPHVSPAAYMKWMPLPPECGGRDHLMTVLG